MASGWREWPPGFRVQHTRSGATGIVVKVMAKGQGNDKIKVRWDVLGHEGWVTPAYLTPERGK